MSIIKFLTKKSTLLSLGFLVLFAFVAPVDAWAQIASGAAEKTGPFSAFLWRAAKLFMQTRNTLFVIAAFAFIAYAWTAIKDGKVEWEKIFYLIVGLTILGVAGWVVSYMANPDDANAIVTDYQNLDNTKGWD